MTENIFSHSFHPQILLQTPHLNYTVSLSFYCQTVPTDVLDGDWRRFLQYCQFTAALAVVYKEKAKFLALLEYPFMHLLYGDHVWRVVLFVHVIALDVHSMIV